MSSYIADRDRAAQKVINTTEVARSKYCAWSERQSLQPIDTSLAHPPHGPIARQPPNRCLARAWERPLSARRTENPAACPPPQSNLPCDPRRPAPSTAPLEKPHRSGDWQGRACTGGCDRPPTAMIRCRLPFLENGEARAAPRLIPRLAILPTVPGPSGRRTTLGGCHAALRGRSADAAAQKLRLRACGPCADTSACHDVNVCVGSCSTHQWGAKHTSAFQSDAGHPSITGHAP